MSAKYSTRVSIFGEDYTLKSDTPPEHTRAVAAYVDRAIRDVMGQKGVDLRIERRDRLRVVMGRSDKREQTVPRGPQVGARKRLQLLCGSNVPALKRRFQPGRVRKAARRKGRVGDLKEAPLHRARETLKKGETGVPRELPRPGRSAADGRPPALRRSRGPR